MSHPRIECCITGCTRGTTRLEPGSEFICGKHWQRIPRLWRQRLANMRRRHTIAERNFDQVKAARAARAWWSIWDRCKRHLEDPESEMVEGMPASMHEELRRTGLL
jgi:hypothetical protein